MPEAMDISQLALTSAHLPAPKALVGLEDDLVGLLVDRRRVAGTDIAGALNTVVAHYVAVGL